jgi:Ca2+-binding RTX toxin-like protein
MSVTRIRRAAVLTLAGLACSVALASPAHAAGSIEVKKNGGVLAVTGSTGGDSITVDQPGGFGTRVTVTVSGAPVIAGPGCVKLSNLKVECDETFQIGVVGGEGDDSIVVNSNTRSLLNGNLGHDVIFAGSGNDELRGAGGDDTLRGGPGVDTADGGTGSDRCTAETESRCEI